jgi:BarA-like signal transduction histidine kinase
MLISKSIGTWGANADDATFNLEVVGHTPDEVAHLETLASEPSSLSATFEGGALKIALSFKRKLTLAEQSALKAKADADAADNAKKAAVERQAQARKDALEAAAQARADQIMIDRRAQDIADERAKAAKK